MEAVGINALKRVAADVVIAVTGCARKTGDVDPVFLHGCDDLGLVIFRHAVDFIETRTQRGEHLFAEAVYRVRDAGLSENILTHGYAPSFPI